MSARTKVPPRVIVGLVATVVLDTVIQLTWKMAVSHLPEDAGPYAILTGALSRPVFYVAMGVFAVQMINWLTVLKHADLSYAQPFTALSYISVLALSAHSLHETVSPTKILGVGLILIGVFFISRTPFRTPPAGSSASPSGAP